MQAVGLAEQGFPLELSLSLGLYTGNQHMDDTILPTYHDKLSLLSSNQLPSAALFLPSATFLEVLHGSPARHFSLPNFLYGSFGTPTPK